MFFSLVEVITELGCLNCREILSRYNPFPQLVRTRGERTAAYLQNNRRGGSLQYHFDAGDGCDR